MHAPGPKEAENYCRPRAVAAAIRAYNVAAAVHTDKKVQWNNIISSLGWRAVTRAECCFECNARNKLFNKLRLSVLLCLIWKSFMRAEVNVVCVCVLGRRRAINHGRGARGLQVRRTHRWRSNWANRVNVCLPSAFSFFSSDHKTAAILIAPSISAQVLLIVNHISPLTSNVN